MNILVTGANGFIGKNLVLQLKNEGYNEIYEFDRNTNKNLLEEYTQKCDFVYHLAGVNRPKNEEEFMKGNFDFTSKLLDLLKKNNNKSPVLITSSIQAERDNPYGKSKKAGEDLLFKYGDKNNVKIFVYRLPNVFGKWSRPNYNSVIATFCYNISRDLPIKVNDPSVELNLVYIDDVVNEFIRALNNKENREGKFCKIPIVYKRKLREIVDLIFSFKNSRETRSIPNMTDEFVKKLYSTYLTFLPEDNFSYDLKMNIDERGSFTEFIRTRDRGQISINISKPGIIKGNHWHNTKSEKFLVVRGEGIIRFRKINSDKVIEYHVSGKKLKVVDIPPGYTHNIENIGDEDMVTIIWANEPFDPKNPDTYYLEV